MPLWSKVYKIEGIITEFSYWSRQITIGNHTFTFPGERETIHFKRWILVDPHGEDRPDSEIIGMHVTLHHDRSYVITDFS